MSYLVDSDWIIDAIAGVESALAPLQQETPRGVAVSVITLGEIFEGAFGFPDPEVHLETLRQFLAGFPIIALIDPIMALFAQHRYRLRRQGTPIPDLDLLIAATALHYDLILLTHNTRHFARIPNLHIYRPS